MKRTLLRGAQVVSMVPGQPDFPQADILIHADPQGRAEPHGGAFAETHAPQ